MECNDWFKKRRYLHFDKRVSYCSAVKIVTDRSKVASWNFFPFLHTVVKSSKVNVNNRGCIERRVKERDICYACHIDAHIYAFYAKVLEQKYEMKIQEHHLHENVIGFRKIKDAFGNGRNNIHFAKSLFDQIKEKAPCVAICFDIEKFFDNLDHRILKRKWTAILNEKSLDKDHYAVFKSITKYSYVDKDSVYKIFNITKKSRRLFERICEPKDFRERVRGAGHIVSFPVKRTVEK
jgi:hypothetical protein